ncbi:MAG: argininosuccinate lyase [Armatimonadota bacterium]
MKLWGGRFSSDAASEIRSFLDSFSFDVRLAKHDVLGSIAHAKMLTKCGILSAEDGAVIEKGLRKILEEVESGNIRFNPDSEDVHTAVEVRLRELIGEAAGKLHTARSRNDQVVTDLRLWLRDEIASVDTDLKGLQKALLDQADAHVDTLMPGYTHLQRAQPIVLAHHLLAYFWMLQRDRERLADCLRRVDVSPLGAAALSGTSFPIDREAAARELGFSAVAPNSLDAVSDRDFAVEFLAAASLIMVHLSRLAEEFVLWSSSEFGFVELDDAYTTGSSIMPQKKNPDAAELIRGKAGRIFGHLMGLLTTLKALPLTYNKDLQEDKEALFDTVDTLRKAISAFTGMVCTARFNRERMERAAEDPFMAATDVADYMAKHGVPFRQAHEIVGRMVRFCLERNCALSDLTHEQLKSFWSGFPPEYKVPSARECAAARNSFGGTAPERVREQLNLARQIWQQHTLQGSE